MLVSVVHLHCCIVVMQQTMLVLLHAGAAKRLNCPLPVGFNVIASTTVITVSQAAAKYFGIQVAVKIPAKVTCLK